MKALSVHGGGALLERTSSKVGLRGQYGPAGIARLSGLEGRNSPDDMKPSSSASQSERTDEQRGDVSLDEVCRYNDGGLRCFDFRMAVRRYFMGTNGNPQPTPRLQALGEALREGETDGWRGSPIVPNASIEAEQAANYTERACEGYISVFAPDGT